jgi:restriction system protein
MLLELVVPAANNVVFVDHKNVRGESKEISLSAKQQQHWYEYLIYSMLVKAVYDISFEGPFELYETMAANVTTLFKSPKTGFDAEATIASVVVPRAEARSIDPSHINPIETFRVWKGVAAKVLSEMIPVQPTVVFDKNDARLIHGRDVLSEMSETQNLAVMDWEDFEHLVRQLFELEFKSTGADVRVTRSSRDRGVDAIVFDPDPIRGGKVII